MSTIPITLKDRQVSYTVVGAGARRSNAVPVSAVVLGRAGRLRRAELFRELDRVGFDSIISVESAQASGERAEIEALAGAFPTVRFLSLKEAVSAGEYVNIGLRESSSPFVFVLHDDMRLSTSTLSSRFFERLSERARLCVVPSIGTRNAEPVPTIVAPALEGSALRFVALPPARDGEKTVAPFDFCGIYHKERFMLLGGFDYTIPNPYWQRLDFGMRAWLWGEEILHVQALKLTCERPPVAEDTTTDAAYARFFLKNLAVTFRGDHGALPLSRALPFAFGAGLGLFRALSEFRAAREWVRVNRYRFRCDARGLVDLWEPLSP